MDRESYAAKLDRDARRDRHNTAKAKHKELIEKHGKGTDTVNGPDGGDQEVEGADCPDCEGVLVVVEKPRKYPPVQVKCTGDCDR